MKLRYWSKIQLFVLLSVGLILVISCSNSSDSELKVVNAYIDSIYSGQEINELQLRKGHLYFKISEECSVTLPDYVEVKNNCLAATLFDKTDIESVEFTYECKDSLGVNHLLERDILVNFNICNNKLLRNALTRLLNSVSDIEYASLFVEFGIVQRYMPTFEDYGDYFSLVFRAGCVCDGNSSRVLSEFASILLYKAGDTGDSTDFWINQKVNTALGCNYSILDTVWFGKEDPVAIVINQE